MPAYPSALDARGAAFAENARAMARALEPLAALEARVREREARAGDAPAGLLSPRERVDLLLDRGAPYVELAPLAGCDTEDGDVPLITGIGFVSGARCVVVADAGREADEAARAKRLRAERIARDNALPMIALAESRAPPATEVSRIIVLHGAPAHGAAPGHRDCVIAVRASGDVVCPEHAYVAKDDCDAIRLAREVVLRLGWPERRVTAPARAHARPFWPETELLGVVPSEATRPIDVREIVARIADGSELTEYGAAWGADTVCVHATIMGHACGIVGGPGSAGRTDAEKAARFAHLCDEAGVPIVVLYDDGGPDPDAAERLVTAVAGKRVPTIAIVLRAAADARSGDALRALAPRFLFAWPAASSTATSATVDGVIDPRDTRRLLGFVLDVCDGRPAPHGG